MRVMATIRKHLCVSIEGLLRYTGRRKITFMEDENGNRVSDKDARKFIAECKAKGYKLLPNDECEGFDPFGCGCPGHVISKVESEGVNNG